MNRVVLSKDGAVLSLAQVGERFKITMSSERVMIDRLLDRTEMAALKIFMMSLDVEPEEVVTPGGDTNNERGG